MTVHRFPMRRSAATAALMLAACALTSQPSSAQQVRATATHQLSLEEALRLAERQSENVAAARAGLTRAAGQRLQSRSQLLPQVNGNAGFTRTLKSQFSGLSFGGGADTAGPPPPPTLCAPRIPANATPAERNAAIAQAITCPEGGGGFDFSSTGFGAENQWVVGLQFAQTVFSGGRIQGQNQAADAQERSARIELTAQQTQTRLDVAQAYYDASLADRLVTISQSALAQTEEILTQTRLARQVGNQSEFDLLRATVTRDNQKPLLIQARGNRQIAYFRLKQLLDVPLDDSVALTTPLPETLATGATSAPLVADRAPVRQLEEAVRAQEGLVKAAKAENIPSIAIVSGYQRLYFPTNLLPNLGDARQNWTVGVSSNFNLFTGGRVKGSVMIAQAGLDETRARLQQTRELATLDSRIAMNQFEQAEAEWRASQGTTEQAQRAYEIDQIRYREGISTQTDLAQSRLLLEQAQANRAQAARNFAVARLRLELLPDLPLQLNAGSSAASSRPSGNVP